MLVIPLGLDLYLPVTEENPRPAIVVDAAQPVSIGASGLRLEPVGPSAGAMEDRENLYLVAAESIRDHKRGTRDDELSGPGHATLAAHPRMMLQRLHGREDPFDRGVGRSCAFLGEVFVSRFQMVASERGPL